jgi:parallel beta-helix repeat protein
MAGTKSWRFSIFAIGSALLSLQILTTCAFGQTYYVSSAGNDANDGKSTTAPWKTISKVNSVTFVSGDAISFRGGDIFFGQINVNKSNISLGSYGSGQKPVITGAIQLSGWTVYNGSIYVAQASSLVKNLYANGVQMTLARYPNTGFLTIGTTNGSTTITATGLNQASGYWNGANVRIRTVDWKVETRTVSSYNGTTVTLSSVTKYPLVVGWGFYLDNKLAALDAPGEWYCDPSNNKVYFYAPGGVDPNTLTVNGSILDYGVNSSSNNITVKGLEFDYQANRGINFSAGHNISILSNTIYGGLTDGIQVAGPNCTISNNTIQNVNGNGIEVAWGTNCVISNNTVKSIGLVKGYGMAIGILSEGTYATISSNHIDSIGSDGIYASSHDLVQQNVVTHTMLISCDGGAIYTGFGNSYVTIQNNIISDVLGDNEGTPNYGGINQSWTSAHGIYLDNGSSNDVVKNNTIIRANSDALMVNYGTHNHTLSNNTCYDCGSGRGGQFLYVAMNTTNDGKHIITKNIFCPASKKQTIVQLQDSSAVLYSHGVIDSNYYLNPYGNTIPFETLLKPGGWSENDYSFAGWKAATGLDAHTKYIVPASYQRDTIFTNSTANPVMVNLPPVIFYDLDNNSVAGSFILAPFSSKILIRDTVHVNSTITRKK